MLSAARGSAPPSATRFGNLTKTSGISSPRWRQSIHDEIDGNNRARHLFKVAERLHRSVWPPGLRRRIVAKTRARPLPISETKPPTSRGLRQERRVPLSDHRTPQRAIHLRRVDRKKHSQLRLHHPRQAQREREHHGPDRQQQPRASHARRLRKGPRRRDHRQQRSPSEPKDATPTSLRNDYLTVLEALTSNHNPEPFVAFAHKLVDINRRIPFGSFEQTHDHFKKNGALDEPNSSSLNFLPLI